MRLPKLAHRVESELRLEDCSPDFLVWGSFSCAFLPGMNAVLLMHRPCFLTTSLQQAHSCSTLTLSTRCSAHSVTVGEHL